MASGDGVKYITGGGESKVLPWSGIYYGYIAVNVDPTDTGRVKLRVPQVLGTVTSGWASPVVPVTYIPKVGTAVAVMFVGGDPAHPVWLGNFAIAGTAPVVINAGPPSNSSPGEVGEIWYDSTDGMKTWEWNGASWIEYQIGTGGVAANIGLTEPTITGGTITGSQFIADGTSGEFLGYTGTPVLNNMNISASPVPGSDGHGNTYLDGLTVYNGAAHIQVHVNPTVLAPAVEMPTGLTSEHTAASIYSWSPTKGAAYEQLVTYIQGPASTHDSNSVSILLLSSAKDGSGTAQGALQYNGTAVAYWDAAGLHNIGQAWQAMTLGNGWAAGSSPNVQPQYRKISSPPNSVEIIGTLSGAGASSAVFFQLPSGYRPSSQQMIPAQSTSATAGNYFAQVGNTGNIGISGTSFTGTYVFHGIISLDA